MSVRMHLVIRAILLAGFIFAGMAVFIALDVKGIISLETWQIIVGCAALSIPLQIPHYIFVKTVPVRCPKCSKNKMFDNADFYLSGPRHYTCQNCDEIVWTTFLAIGNRTGPGSHSVGPWHAGFKDGNEKRGKAVTSANQKEVERLKSGRKSKAVRKGLIRTLWDKILPPSY